MCATFGCGPTVVSKKGRYRQTHNVTLQLFIVDDNALSPIFLIVPECYAGNVHNYLEKTG